MNGFKKAIVAVTTTVLISSSVVGAAVFACRDRIEWKWISGDFHNHTYLTDGSNSEKEVVSNAFGKYGLDWMANSEHGGTSSRDPYGNPLAAPIWRWITLKDMSYPIITDLRKVYPDKNLIQGVEWNVPSHEHASVGIVTDEPKAISDFEYMFDAGDKDTSREGLVKNNTTHQNAVAGAKWLEDNYRNTSYFIINHPSRKQKFSIADIRDFNNAAPNVCFGLEGIPGHQKEINRGGYDADFGDNTYKARTYGGADYMIAKVGGLWDALLGEGRRFWVFTNSDFHDAANDFWPGEYAKSYTWVNKQDNKSIVAGMRSGDSFAVLGDLINGLEFDIKSRSQNAATGQELKTKKGSDIEITIKFKSPEKNNNNDKVAVDHVDLIAGEVTGMTEPGTEAYNKDTNETAKVVARFTSKDWRRINGWNVIKFKMKNIKKDMYFRLRGTNLGLNVENETDASGNPLSDTLMGTNDSSKAYKDLWFYSNPVFVNIK